MKTLYRKYRPTTFSDTVGQNHVTDTIKRELETDQPAHAYLFVGPRGTGKTTLARLIARSLNCENRKKGTADPCNACTSCQNIMHDRQLDVVEIDAATHTQVDNVRETIIASVSVPPSRKDAFRVYIIDEVHMLSKHAFNALLKTLEEPPSHVVFILATTEIHKVPETIISRCERFNLRPIQQSAITERLSYIAKEEKVAISDTVLRNVARASDGSLRDALSLLSQVLSLAKKGAVSDADAAHVVPSPHWDEALSLLKSVFDYDHAKALQRVQSLVDTGISVNRLIADLIELLRAILLRSLVGASYTNVALETETDTVKSILKKTTSQELQTFTELLLRYSETIQSPQFPQLPLELAIARMANHSEKQHKSATDSPNQARQVGETKNTDTPKPDGRIKILKQEWGRILDALKSHNHSLSAFLKVGHPLTITDNKLTLGFKFNFHADRVQDRTNRDAAESVISERLGEQITIDCVVDSQYTQNHKNFNGEDEPEVQNIIDVMGGGEVV